MKKLLLFALLLASTARSHNVEYGGRTIHVDPTRTVSIPASTTQRRRSNAPEARTRSRRPEAEARSEVDPQAAPPATAPVPPTRHGPTARRPGEPRPRRPRGALRTTPRAARGNPSRSATVQQEAAPAQGPTAPASPVVRRPTPAPPSIGQFTARRLLTEEEAGAMSNAAPICGYAWIRNPTRRDRRSNMTGNNKWPDGFSIRIRQHHISTIALKAPIRAYRAAPFGFLAGGRPGAG